MIKQITIAAMMVALSGAVNAEQRYRVTMEGQTFDGTRTEIVDNAFESLNRWSFLVDDELFASIDVDNNSKASKQELNEFLDKLLNSNK